MTAGALAGQVALVTGGAGSVGEQIVRALSDAGATVLINCFHSWEAASRLAAELTEAGRKVAVLRASVAKPQQVERMFAQVEQEYGRLDVLVNNAAAGTFARWDELTEEHLDRAFATNVKGALWCARAARPLLARSGHGAIVNVSSIGAGHAPADYLAVGISKAGLEALTRYLAAEFAVDGIRVNTASAALIDNEVGRRFPGAESVAARTRAATPLGRLGTPADLAGVVLLLAQPQSAWITGQTVLADGGLSLMRAVMSPAPPAEQPTGPAATQPTEALAASEIESDPIDGDPIEADPIVVVGMGIAVPGASSPEEFWRLLEEGADLFIDAPPDRWSAAGFYDPDPRAADKSYQTRSGFITDFRPHPRLAAEPDWAAGGEFTARWLRHCAYQALDGVAAAPGDRFSVYLGYTPDGSQHLQEALVRAELDALAAARPDAPAASALAQLARDVLPVSATDDLVPSPHLVGRAAVQGIVPDDAALLMVDTACSSSLYAIDLGLRDLLSGRADVALCGGAFALAPSGSVLFSKVQGLSRRGEVRALDSTADGVLFSDGAGLVAMKRLSRARADGDPVLGVVAGTGLSADGQGKAIYAPASSGQQLAVERALARTGVAAADVDWVIAHATGTPGGDEAEFLALRAAYGGDRPVPVTSNKSLIGHTGWAAGVVSLIHCLLALRHSQIPAQHRFTRAPDSFDLGGTNLRVPSAAVPWPPHADRARTAAISGFGFGGTNAHLLVQEYRPDRPTGRRQGLAAGGQPSGDPVIVGWSAHLPGTDDLDEVVRWANGQLDLPESFGPRYPRPPFQRLRLPGGAIRATDRTQLMAVECMQRLPQEVRALCERHRDTVGVVVGHTGPTRNATLYALRAYLGELDRAAAAQDNPEPLTLLLKELREYATDQVDAPTEDSFPGEMPNVIAARLSNYFDLRGLCIAVDAGANSLAEAFVTASHYLADGELDVALVAGVGGNTLPSWRALAAGDPPVGEGAVLFALTRREIAQSEGLPVLAELTEATQPTSAGR